MITVQQLAENDWHVHQHLAEPELNVRVRASKLARIGAPIEKIFYPDFLKPSYADYYILTFTDVLLVSENLATGFVTLNLWPGEWLFELQWQATNSGPWVTRHTEVAWVKETENLLRSY